MISIFRSNFFHLFSLIILFCLISCHLFSLPQMRQVLPGPLSAGHKNLSGSQSCSKCHSENLKIEEKKCLACHSEIAARISTGKGLHKDKDKDCGVCHIEHQGNDWKLAQIDVKNFNHAETGYILESAHGKIELCTACHRMDNSFPREKTQSFLLIDSRCISCHPSPHPGDQDECQNCHHEKNWRITIWDKKDNI